MRRGLIRAIGIISVLLLSSRPLEALSIDPPTWEQLVLDADFVGVVECTEAGGIVARYRILESWKGRNRGESILIRFRLWGTMGDTYPVVFCGSRFLVAISADNSSQASGTPVGVGSSIPLWWRDIKADYSTMHYFGFEPVSYDFSPLCPGYFESEYRDLGRFHRAVDGILALTPNDREYYLLKRLSKKYLMDRGIDLGDVFQRRSWLRRIEQAKNAEDLLRFLKMWAGDGTSRLNIFLELLRQCGESVVLKSMERWTVLDFPPTENDTEMYQTWFQSTMDEIRKRLKDPVELDDALEVRSPEVAPTPEMISEMRRHLHQGPVATMPEYLKYANAFEVLTVYEPETVADYLVRWPAGEAPPCAAFRGHKLASYFCWRCGGDRPSQLRKLLNAREPYIRVTGAVYLCIENRSEGMEHLRRFMDLEGEPGILAALNLCRRGFKPAVPRMLDVLKSPAFGPYGQEIVDQSFINLRSRVTELISNTVQFNNLPLPEILTRRNGEDIESWQRRYHLAVLSWWNTHQDKAQLHDPWLPLLEAQKID